MKNLKMNEDTYILRRKVMGVIYQAKTFTELPRINVRITENDTESGKVLGRGRVGGAVVIFIPLRAFNLSENDFKYVVYHEIIHTAFNKGHSKAGLMRPVIETGLSSEEVDNLFKCEVNRNI